MTNFLLFLLQRWFGCFRWQWLLHVFLLWTALGSWIQIPKWFSVSFYHKIAPLGKGVEWSSLSWIYQLLLLLLERSHLYHLSTTPIFHLSLFRSSPLMRTTSPVLTCISLVLFFILCRPLKAFRYSDDHLDHQASLHFFIYFAQSQVSIFVWEINIFWLRVMAWGV